MNLRSKRLNAPLDAGAAAYLDSTPEDAALVREDILGTIAHAAVLEQARVLSADEAGKLRAALAQLHAQADQFELSSDFEDVHMNVEAWLTQHVGDLGKKVHTGRSRNDQVALDLRLWTRTAVLDVADAIQALASALHGQAKAHPDAILPGHTHFQIAQPVLLSHQVGAHAARLVRDLERLQGAWQHVNVSPLGAGALAGSPHAIDPSLAAKLLAFEKPFDNSLDAVSDRDFVHEVLFAEALLLNHLSGLAEEIILFTHPAFGFTTLDDAHATGSSLMPQKKNPDVLEVLRARAATLLGALTASLAQTRALPLSYNRDLQEQKRLLLQAHPVTLASVKAMASVVAGLEFHEDAMKKAAGMGYSDATDLADYLVGKGVPFRQAHEQAAACVRLALDQRVPLSSLPVAAFQTVNPKIGPDVLKVLGPEASVAAKQTPGGTGPKAAANAWSPIQADLATLQKQFSAQRATIERAETNLLKPLTQVKNR